MSPRTNDPHRDDRHGDADGAGERRTDPEREGSGEPGTPKAQAGARDGAPAEGAPGAAAGGPDGRAPSDPGERAASQPDGGAPSDSDGRAHSGSDGGAPSDRGDHAASDPDGGAPSEFDGRTASDLSAHAASDPDGGAASDPEGGAPSDSDGRAHSGSDGGAPSEPGERVAAVRRVAAAGRRRHAAQLGLCAALLAVAMTGGAIALGADREPAPVPAASSAVDPAVLGGGNLDAGIAALQAHLRSQPRDSGSWATLGLAYVEQARTKGDPSRYPQAEKALGRSLSLAPDNDQALAGRAALAAARHDFKNALAFADRALRQNPYSERALSSRIDALVELGRYAEAAKAAGTADARKPGVPVFTRYAYVRELRGDVTTARRVLRQALSAATSPGDTAYVAAQLGQLAFNQGDHKAALTFYARALAADDDYLPALEGRARAQAASGDRAAAIKGLETVVARYPLPGPLVELGELYEARGTAGDRARAGRQYALVDAWIALARANGVNADLDTALAAADHGDRTAALRAARAEWSRRHTVHTADALAWALHVNGRDAEALPYARRATGTGYRNASFLYHRGVIELATGHRAAGRASLASALKLNPGFSPLGAARARKALEGTK
ncbi:hypothetical protein GCM10010503_27270 [Streptomyces lucensis JCM 4490]|uniref:Tetratricopeptide repeat protein n=1 Tax=Streptomyces lucensis JCM 4490 TaxID=1306176 RepID=A0A918J5X1_9ACTN|nr:tetratricopeptide repeat protein [Streptomyces lucensis]GGW48992.1 hypothetical protein GCM10010503_27270 [Streptomyces lucensis JCM 4490]